MNNHNPSAFVAGATGYTGREVVRALREKNLVTMAHVRPDSPRLTEWRERFEKLGAATDTTPWQNDKIRAAIAKLKPDLIFALLGTTKARMKERLAHGGNPKDADYAAVDFNLTKMLIDAGVAAGHHPTFIYLSSMGAGSRAAGAYLKARNDAEDHLKKSGLPFLIARPGIITGSDRDQARPLELWGARILDTALSAAGAVGLEKISERYRSTTNKVLANALVRLALDPENTNRIFESEGLR